MLILCILTNTIYLWISKEDVKVVYPPVKWSASSQSLSGLNVSITWLDQALPISCDKLSPAFPLYPDA